ncbi:hypothetical protein KSB_55780 [Ktedonobacter robiniae]|uniref:Luciferase-like domain-containing protein n=1 Tax=Ktedonobacter robiniae TaxID=2778365 RepID=A0ABQ3UWG3_9CHLR|nr:hypothetical protein KSB_55780 [Ktedonobacter robiniae]
MRYGFVIPIGDVQTIAELAHLGEEAGWNGMFYWDGICIESMAEMYDPWIVMAAMAMRTKRVRLEPLLLPSRVAVPGKSPAKRLPLITSHRDVLFYQSDWEQSTTKDSARLGK